MGQRSCHIDGHTEEFIDAFKISETAIGYKVKNAGFKLPKRGGKTHGRTEEQFRELYERHDGDVVKIMEESRYTRGTTMTLCNRYNLKPKNIPPRESSKGEVDLKYFRAFGLDDSV